MYPTLDRAGVLSCRFALCPSTWVWSIHGVSFLPRSSLLIRLQHYCRLLSLHCHTTKCVTAWLTHIIMMIGLTMHGICPELFVSNSVFPCFALNPSKHVHLGYVHVPDNIADIKVRMKTALYSLLFSLTGFTISKSSSLIVCCRNLLHILRLFLLFSPSIVYRGLPEWATCMVYSCYKAPITPGLRPGYDLPATEKWANHRKNVRVVAVVVRLVAEVVGDRKEQISRSKVVVMFKTQSHRAYDQVTTYLWSKNVAIVGKSKKERTTGRRGRTTGRRGRGRSQGANQSQQGRWSCSKLETCYSKS